MRKRGLSLIELLVVLSIIATLLALALPLVGPMKRRLYLVRCMSQLHQIGLAMKLYQEDHRDRPWPLGRLVPDYVNDPKVLVCPWVEVMFGAEAVKANDRGHRAVYSAPWSSYFVFSQRGLDSIYSQGGTPLSYSQIIEMRRGQTPVVICRNHREPYTNFWTTCPVDWVFPEAPLVVLRLDGSVSLSKGGGVYRNGTGWGTMMEALNL